jgi:hypothetical protein
MKYTFLIISVLLISGCTQLVEDQSEELPALDCEQLTEEECRENPVCDAIYGPSGCSNGICTTDIVYHGCFERS